MKILEEIQDWARNSKFGRKFKILPEIEDLARNSRFYQEFKVLPKIQHVGRNSRFGKKLKILPTIEDFACQKFNILEEIQDFSKIEDFGRN